MPRKPKKTERTAPLRAWQAVLEAFGDPDDHLRLSTLIAEVVAKVGESASLRGVARRLTDEHGPRSWRDRRIDFQEIVRRMPSGTILLRDPDAFAEAYKLDRCGEWDDAELCRERSEFFDSLLESIERGAIGIERTAPDPLISERLAGAPVPEESSRIDPKDPYTSSVGPDARGALDWLLDRQHLSEAAIDELIEDERGVGPELDRHLILVTYDHLSPSTRAAAYRIAVLRGEQTLNGTLGPFPVKSKSAAHAVTKAQLDELFSCGFLRRTSAGSGARMPRIVRDVVLARADAEDPEAVEKDHQWAFSQRDQRPLPASSARLIECHYHAVHGLLIKEAIETAKFYATDLRELAIRLSRKEQWLAAANVYRKIVEDFDSEDAYAWEYRGYNLVRADAKAHADTILEAYERAFELDSTNPLYHGRLLGFRGRLGQDIRDELRRSIDLYVNTWRGMDRFASEVIKGLRRGGRDRVAKNLLNANRFLLKHPEVKRIMDEGWGHHSLE